MATPRAPARSALLLCGLLTALCPLSAQTLNGRHQIELRTGVWNQFNDVRTEVGGSVSVTAGGSGVLGGLAYGHWLSEAVALRVSAGALAASVDTEIAGANVRSETAAVSQLNVGVKYYFPGSTYGTKVRPYVVASVGPVIGTQSEARAGSTVSVESRTEAAMGGELGAGVDFVLGRHFLLSVGLGLVGMTDFERPIGGSDNYSGFNLALGFSYVFGGK